MATITVSVKNDVEKKFRKMAGAKYGKRKGYLGEAITEAMRVWLKAEGGNVKRAVELLEKGHDGGGLTYRHRDELHER